MANSRSSTEEHLRVWQERISRSILGALCLLAVVLLGVFGSAMTVSALVIACVAVAILAGLTVWRVGPARLRSGVIFAGTAYAGFMAMLTGNDVGAGVIYLFAGVTLATLLSGWRLAMGYLVFAAGLLGLAAWELANDTHLLPQTASLDPVAKVAGNSFTFLAVGTIVVLSLNFLGRRMRQLLDERGAALERAEEESRERERALAQLQDAHEALQAAQERLITAGKTELLGQLAGGIAHDMNNALTVIHAEAEWMEEQDAEAAGAIIDAVEHATNLTRQLLAIGRRDVVQPRPVNLAHVVEHIGSLLRRTLPTSIEIHAPRPPRVVVHADPSQLQQVFLNLCTNAAHAMPDGGRLEILVDNRDGKAIIEVVDDGHVMDKETLAQVFEPFFSTKPEGVGTGLGLASVQTIIQGLNGSIACHSRPGEGTRFSIELPATTGVLPSVSLFGEPVEDVPDLAGHRVLVVEDEVRVRAVICMLLSAAGAEVLDAGNPDAAIALAESAMEPFDLLWTDVVMPRGGAQSVVDWFQRESPSTGILICTGYAKDDTLRRKVALGSFTLLTKPFSRAEALRACRRALTQERDRAEVA